jgi:hypothetical protein
MSHEQANIIIALLAAIWVAIFIIGISIIKIIDDFTTKKDK